MAQLGAQLWSLDWPRGHVKLHAKGGMMDDLALVLADGRIGKPLYRAPWLDETGDKPAGVLGHLRGEFVCLPWGTPAPDAAAKAPPEALLAAEDFEGHGWPAVADWHLVDRSDRHLTIGLDFPKGNALSRLRRRVEALPDGAGIEISLEVEARHPCRRSLAFHPSFALPDHPGQAELRTGSFAFGLVIPEGEDTPLSLAKPGARFERLDALPLAAGGTKAFDRLPLEGGREEILLLCGIDGRVALADHASRVEWRLDWDPAALPSVALWMSNRGRVQPPWRGRNLCLGIEPCAAGFGGILEQLGDNPVTQGGIASVLEFLPGQITKLSYRLSGQPL